MSDAGGSAEPTAAPRSVAALAVLGVLACLVFAGLLALGHWQLERRAWKHDLIARIERRIHALPVAAPGPPEWSRVSAAADEYRRVRAVGTFLHDREALVQASTGLGPGYWVVTPLRAADGSTVLVNRGFVPPERHDRSTRAAGEPAGEATVTGLLRMSEPGGGFLRRNDPAADRWHSRDVAAIAASRGLATEAAPYFVDAEAAPGAVAGRTDDGQPVPGLTVTRFSDHHLVYALTWYALALMVVVAAWQVARLEWCLRRRRAAQATDAGPEASGASLS